MPRRARGLVDGQIYHALNRGNGEQEVFSQKTRIKQVDASLVSSVKDWQWSSHGERIGNKSHNLVDDAPIKIPGGWDKYVDEPLTEGDLERIQQSLNRQSLFGDVEWVEKTCKEFGLE